ncbi:hypothetical protein B0H14DRAFT_2632934 [Mycena olivaceomarginata]|nr:hypothetical protein B0H14DRAFT_2632934 [Mycena olivaceomarginata]
MICMHRRWFNIKGTPGEPMNQILCGKWGNSGVILSLLQCGPVQVTHFCIVNGNSEEASTASSSLGFSIEWQYLMRSQGWGHCYRDHWTLGFITMSNQPLKMLDIQVFTAIVDKVCGIPSRSLVTATVYQWEASRPSLVTKHLKCSIEAKKLCLRLGEDGVMQAEWWSSLTVQHQNKMLELIRTELELGPPFVLSRTQGCFPGVIIPIADVLYTFFLYPRLQMQRCNFVGLLVWGLNRI